ncbi:MAG: hypothetical protein ACKOBP_01660 [Planctomycetia bacterium]
MAASVWVATMTRCGPRFGATVLRLATTAAPTAWAGGVPPSTARCHAAVASRRAVRDEQYDSCRPPSRRSTVSRA